MPGFLLHQGAGVMCLHGGTAMPTAPNPKVLVDGQPVTTLSAPWTVAGCPFVPPAPGPCATAQWVVGATKVLVGGEPVLLLDSQSVCVPTGAPLTVVSSQTKVTGT